MTVVMTLRLGLRGKLVMWTTVVLVVCTTTLLVALNMVTSRALSAQSEAEMRGVVGKTVEALDLWLDSRERDVQTLSEMEVFAAACRGRRRSEAEQALTRVHQRSSFYENVFLADTSGKLFLDSIGGKSVGIDISSIEGYRINLERVREGRIWVGDAMKSPATGRPVSLITAPIRAGNEIVGMVGTPIELSAFSKEFINKQKVGVTGYLYMMDASGLALAYPEPARILTLDFSKTDFGRAMLDRGSGSLRYTFEGAPKSAEFKQGSRKPWTVVSVVPDRELYASVHTVQLFLLCFGIGTLAVMGCAIWMIATRASRLIVKVVEELDGSASQFTSASTQISAGSQSLAQGAAEQAASIQAIADSTRDITSLTQRNAKHSEQVATLMKETGQTVADVNRLLAEMLDSMRKITNSSDSIGKIIRVIDEIAFQTNILALNAAVEAARAGEAGMGFAVVADEVRNLAQRSAQAAKDTTDLISDSISNSKEGGAKLGHLATSIVTITGHAEQVRTVVDEIHGATREQAQGMRQISDSMSQMDEVTQKNASTAEESASSSEELNAQAETLLGIVSQLRQLVYGAEENITGGAAARRNLRRSR